MPSLILSASACTFGIAATNVDTFKAYEVLRIGISSFESSDVLTASVGVADDDNVGGFLDQWGE